MVAYFVRRLVGGFATLLASTFVLYSLLIYTPGSLHSFWQVYQSGQFRPINASGLLYMANYFEVFKPWPLSYLGWMFDPDDTEKLDVSRHVVVSNGLDIEIGNIRLRGSGLLTGDLGYSGAVARDQSVLELMGSSFWLYDTIILGLTFLGMAFAVYQRIGHRPRYTTSTFPFTPYDKASLTFRYTRPS